MKIIILWGLLGAISSAPLMPQRLLSASNSNELLLNLNNAHLLPLQFQGPFNSLTLPFSGIVGQQQQAQAPGLPQLSLSSLDQFVGLIPNQIPFPGQVNFAQGSQWGQLDPSQPQTALQNQQGPSHVMPYAFSFKLPQDQTQMLQYYPVYMYLPWEQPVETDTPIQVPQQTGQQQFEVQVPVYTQFEYMPQQAEPVISRRQQHLAFDPLIGTAPKTAVMPAGGVIAYLQKEMANPRHASTGISMASSSPKPSTTNILTSTIDPTITPESMEYKVKTDNIREP
ncbi:odontogenic ameloblast-associated protein [Rhynchocyon petersi]